MEIQKVLWRRHYKAGYELRRIIVHNGGDQPIEITFAFNPHGDYIGDARIARYLCVKRGIAPILSDPSHQTCSIGFCARDGKWYGWSHRAIHGFAPGDEAREGDLCTETGWDDEWLKDHPELDVAMPVGFKAVDFEDAKMMAQAFAASVS
jgi:hypothetical protein